MLRFDTSLQRWECGFSRLPFPGRAYHTAVLLGTKIWVMGGFGSCTMFHDTWIYDTDILSWESMAIRCWSAEVSSLQECCAAYLVCRLGGNRYGAIAEMTKPCWSARPIVASLIQSSEMRSCSLAALAWPVTERIRGKFPSRTTLYW